jgi:hypothetical protein
VRLAVDSLFVLIGCVHCDQQFTRPLAAVRPLASTSTLPRASTVGIVPSLLQQQQLPVKRSPIDDSSHPSHPHAKHKRRPDVALLEHVSVCTMC